MILSNCVHCNISDIFLFFFTFFLFCTRVVYDLYTYKLLKAFAIFSKVYVGNMFFGFDCSYKLVNSKNVKIILC